MKCRKSYEIVNKVLLAGDKFLPEMDLRQPGFTCSASGPFRKHQERIKIFKAKGDSRHIYKNELDNAFFQHNMAYVDFKGLTRRTAFDENCMIKHC